MKRSSVGRLMVGAVAALGILGAPGHAAAASPGSYIYWDENERELTLSDPGGTPSDLVPYYDPNGQMCIFPDGSGRFTTGYNPTLANQDNPGSLKPIMKPPVGEAVWDIHGNFTGTTLFVPGPYRGSWESASDPGGDIPPDTSSGPPTFNNNGTMTGCVFDSHGNLFGVDLGNSQGNFPPADSGRLIEWYAASNYTTECIIYGPNAGGDAGSKHHVDGSGGLQQPGTLARDASDNILVPVDTTITDPVTGGILPAGKVLSFTHSSFPADASACHNGVDAGNQNTASDSFHQAQFTTFISGSPAFLPLPAGIARDPVCGCWAVTDVIGSPAVAFFDDSGTPLPRAVPAGFGPPGNPDFNPYGLAFDPAGNLFLVDIHVTPGCNPEVPNSCVGVNFGPENNAGQLLEFTFASATAGPSGPATAIGTGYSFPVSVTACNPQTQTCPSPAPQASTPDAPWVPGLLVAGGAAAAAVVPRRWRRPSVGSARSA